MPGGVLGRPGRSEWEGHSPASMHPARQAVQSLPTHRDEPGRKETGLAQGDRTLLATPQESINPSTGGSWVQREARQVAGAWSRGLKGEVAATPRTSCLTLCPKDGTFTCSAVDGDTLHLNQGAAGFLRMLTMLP